MPYEIRAQGGEFCVMKQGTNERMGCHPTREKAMAQMRALHANEPMGKAFTELKAEPMTTGRLDSWLKGEIPRRILVLPFGGPLPRKGAPLGVDLDGEWFDGTTDIYGESAFLRSSRERMVDWHHDLDPKGRMKGAILGRIEMDAEPEDDGIWADFWANAGEKRRRLVAELERRNIPLYGSSQALYKKADAETGHITTWPLIRHTITTSPQNTWAVVPSLKAMLTADLPLDEVGITALKAALLGLDLADLRPTFPDEAADTYLDGAATDAAKAGRVLSAKTIADLERVLDLAERELPALIRAIVARNSPSEAQEVT